MKKFASKKFTGKVFFSLIVSAALFLSQTLYQMQDAFAAPASRSAAVLESGSEDFSANFDTLRSQPKVVDRPNCFLRRSPATSTAVSVCESGWLCCIST